MKNVPHPNMFPRAAGESSALVDETNPEVIVTDADVGGVAPPVNPWANPSKLTAFKPAEPEQAGKKLTNAERVIAYLREHGPSAGAPIATALHMGEGGAGIQPFISKAIKDGLIVKHGRGVYALPGQPLPEQPEPAPARAKAPVEKPKKVDAPPEVIVAPAPSPTQSTPPAEGRKPDFVIFVGDVQLLAWPWGGISIQHEDHTIKLDVAQTRALLVLAELRT